MINIKFLKYLSDIGYLNTKFELFLSMHYSKLIKHGDLVLDIGANVGYHTEKFINLTRDTGMVIAFEPVPEMQNILNNNFSKFKNFKLLPNAAGNKNDKSVFFKAVHSSGTMEESGLKIRQFNDEKNTIVEEIVVDVIKIDSLNIQENVSFIKIDVEGGEIDVLLGAKNLIVSNLPYISIEYGDKSYLSYGNTQLTLWDLANDLDYCIYDIFLNRISSLDDWLKCINNFYWDYLLVPKKRLDEFEQTMLK